MKTKITLCIFLLAAFILPSEARAQIPVTDGANIAQSIVNSSQQLVQNTTTATNMIKNFQETVKIYQQGKAYYDALKSIHNLIRDARKVQKTILAIGEISDIYVTNFQKMLSDKNYSAEELSAIAFGYTRLLEESTDLLLEMKEVVNINGLSMTDAERMVVIDRVYNGVMRYRNLTNYYTQKNIAVSYLRSKRKGDTDRIMSLYGNTNERHW